MRLIWIIFPLILFSVVGISESFAQDSNIAPSLKYQLELGVALENITCRDNNILVHRTNGNFACVKETTSEKLGWKIVELDSKIIEDKSNPDPKLVNSLDSLNIIDANNKFAIDFYSQVSQESEENIFFSPWSIYTAFAIAHEGAKGNTAEEMQSVFGFSDDVDQRRSNFKLVNDDLNQKDSKYKLSVANALWLAEGFKPHPEYVEISQNYYDSEVNTVDFGADGIDIINDWVNEKTEEKIEEIFPPGPNPDIQLAITNAIYFKGTWVSQFNPEKTQDGNFWINSDESVTVPMMFLDESPVSIAFLEELQVLEMPYEGEKLSMMILLPNQKDGLEELEDSLSAENLSTWKDELGEGSIQVMMPKFKLETEYDLVSILETLGIHDAFGAADFSGISNSELFINAAVHKAFVDVNEEGTEAAAATGITMHESAPFTLRVDHPFIFIIQDNETGNILFMGRMVNPSE